MPNFNCGGDGCGALSCSDCTPDKLRARYWHEMDLSRKSGECQRDDEEYARRARKWWDTEGNPEVKYAALVKAAERVYPAWAAHDGKLDSKSDLELRSAVKDLRNLLAQQKGGDDAHGNNDPVGVRVRRGRGTHSAGKER